MILHVGVLDKFMPSFVQLVEEEFKHEHHVFWFRDTLELYLLKEGQEIYVCKKGLINELIGYIKLLKSLITARKVILHGLFDGKTIFLLTLLPWVLPKCHWVIWGGDLYQYRNAGESFRFKVKEFFRRFVFRRVGYLLTYIKGDIELARKWYRAKGVHQECLMYLSNVIDPDAFLASSSQDQRNQLRILVGNSADPSNNHLEAFEYLSQYTNLDFKVYTPLSYGDKNYAKDITQKGYSMFGDSFFPLKEFMPIEKYKQFLSTVDVAIFNHKRQQAMGNAITLLGMGKTVYIRSDVSQWELFKEKGVKVFDANLKEFEVIDDRESKLNITLVAKHFSRKKLVEQYREVFKT